MNKIKVKFANNNYGGPSTLEIPESDLGELGGLEKFFGFEEYKKGLESRKISEGDKIRIPIGFQNPDQSIVYNWEIFIVTDKKTLKYDFGTIEFKPRKKLKGIHWYLSTE